MLGAVKRHAIHREPWGGVDAMVSQATMAKADPTGEDLGKGRKLCIIGRLAPTSACVDGAWRGQGGAVTAGATEIVTGRH
jgi:hypothetical protein